MPTPDMSKVLSVPPKELAWTSTAYEPEDYSWVDRNRVDIPAAVAAGLLGLHGARAGIRRGREKNYSTGRVAAGAVARAAIEGGLGFFGVRAARRGAGRVITNLVAPYGYVEDPFRQIKDTFAKHTKLDALKILAKPVIADQPIYEKTKEPNARLGLWDAFWGRPTTRAGNFFIQDPRDPRRYFVNPAAGREESPGFYANEVRNLQDWPGMQMAHARTGEQEHGDFPVVAGAAVHKLPSGAAAVDDWWDFSTHGLDTDKFVEDNRKLRTLMTLLGRAPLVSVRSPSGISKSGACDPINIAVAALTKQAIIKKTKGGFTLYTHDGSRVLGKHPSKEKAMAQERAIQAHKHAALTPTPRQIATKKQVPLSKVLQQLRIGSHEEKEEHGFKLPVAQQVAEDHLKKIPDYYDRLEKMESKAAAMMLLYMNKWASEDVDPADLGGLPKQLGVKTKGEYMAALADIRKSVDEACEKTDETPTQGQKDAGNYKKGTAIIDGLRIKVENPAGSVRKGVDKDGKAWSTKMLDHYGYVGASEGTDGDEVDVFINPDRPITGKVFVVYQVVPDTGELDEHKCVIGALTKQEAEDLYLSNFQKGWKGLGKIEEMTWTKFKDWVKSDAPVNSTYSHKKSTRLAKEAVLALGEDPDMMAKLAVLQTICSVDGNGKLVVDCTKARSCPDLAGLLKSAVAFDRSYSSTRKEPNNRNGKKWLYSFCDRHPNSPMCKGIQRKGPTDGLETVDTGPDKAGGTL